MADWERIDGAFVSPGARVGDGVTLSPGAVIHAGVSVGQRSSIGAAAVIHPGTTIGMRCVVEDGAVVGKLPRLKPGSSAAGAQIGPLHIGDEVTICAGAVIYAGARIEDGVIVGDQAQVRERSSIGPRSVVGRGSCVDFGTRVGARVSIQTGVYLTAAAVVEDDVFLGPGVITTNDDTMGRHVKGAPLAGPVLRRACRVGGGAILVPGVEVGEEAFIGSGAVVTKDVGPREVILGIPGRPVRRVADEDLLERWL